MNAAVGTVAPGEALIPEKPWLRRQGDRIVRYVPPAVEETDPAVRLLRGVGIEDDDPRLEDALQSSKARFEAELKLLQAEFGVPAVKSEVSIDWVPCFAGGMQLLGVHRRGIVITSDFIDGEALNSTDLLPDRLAEFAPEVGAIFEGLREYYNRGLATDRPVLGDIARPCQYMVGVTSQYRKAQVRLVDVDPLFVQPQPGKINDLLFRMEKTQERMLGIPVSL